MDRRDRNHSKMTVSGIWEELYEKIRTNRELTKIYVLRAWAEPLNGAQVHAPGTSIKYLQCSSRFQNGVIWSACASYTSLKDAQIEGFNNVYILKQAAQLDFKLKFQNMIEEQWNHSRFNHNTWMKPRTKRRTHTCGGDGRLCRQDRERRCTWSTPANEPWSCSPRNPFAPTLTRLCNCCKLEVRMAVEGLRPS
jgi:hypothetical protein